MVLKILDNRLFGYWILLTISFGYGYWDSLNYKLRL